MAKIVLDKKKKVDYQQTKFFTQKKGLLKYVVSVDCMEQKHGPLYVQTQSIWKVLKGGYEGDGQIR